MAWRAIVLKQLPVSRWGNDEVCSAIAAPLSEVKSDQCPIPVTKPNCSLIFKRSGRGSSAQAREAEIE